MLWRNRRRRCCPASRHCSPAYTATPPRVTVSPLGDSIVTVGAVRHALDYVEANALGLELAGSAGTGAAVL